MHSNHEAIHSTYLLCLAFATNRFTPKWYQAWKLSTMHIPAEQIESALEMYGVTIGTDSVTIPVTSLNKVHPPKPYVKGVFGGVNTHRQDYEISRANRG